MVIRDARSGRLALPNRRVIGVRSAQR
jgi:hypothetical protein